MLSTDCTASRHVGKWLASSLSLPSALVYVPGDAQLISNEANIYKQDGTSAGGSLLAAHLGWVILPMSLRMLRISPWMMVVVLTSPRPPFFIGSEWSLVRVLICGFQIKQQDGIEVQMFGFN